MDEQPKNSVMLRLRPLVFLLPAALTAFLILFTLPATQPVLAAIPERLSRLQAEEAMTEDIRLPEAEVPEPEGAVPEELTPGQYADGVYTGSSRGYGGSVTVQVRVESGRITDVEILSAPGETEPYFTLARTVLSSVIDEQTWELDAVSGATYSSRGILGAVQNALTGETVENAAPVQTSPAGTTVQDSYEEPAAYLDGTYYGSAEGFGGTIRIEAVVSGGDIASIRVVSAPYETAEYFSRAQNVIASILNAGTPNVDAVSGATYSSTGIINAVKRALGQASSDEAEELTDEEETDDDRHEDTGTEGSESRQYPDGSYSVSVWCEDGDGLFRYEVTVSVRIEDGRVTAVDAEKGVDESEDPEMNETYMGYAVNGRTRQGVAYIGIPEQIVNRQSADHIDAVSGATYSSEAIRNAAAQTLSMGEAGFSGDGPEAGSAAEDASGEPSGHDREASDPDDGTASSGASAEPVVDGPEEGDEAALPAEDREPPKEEIGNAAAYGEPEEAECETE